LLTAVLRLLHETNVHEGDSAELVHAKGAAWTLADQLCMNLFVAVLVSLKNCDDDENAEELLPSGEDTLDSDGRSPLNILCAATSPDCPESWSCGLVDLLLEECGCDINARDHQDGGNTVLHQWAEHNGDGNAFCVLFLLERGADLNAQNDSAGDTLAHIYADSQPSTADFDALTSSALFVGCADLSLRNKRGMTPLQLAQELLEELTQRAPPVDEEAIKRQQHVVAVLTALGRNKVDGEDDASVATDAADGSGSPVASALPASATAAAAAAPSPPGFSVPPPILAPITPEVIAAATAAATAPASGATKSATVVKME
jgi:hypothetical protein